MMNPSTIEQLKALRLVGMLEAWSEQQSTSTYHDLSFDERLALLVEREHLRRAQQRLQRRIKQAQLTTTASLADIDFQVARGLSKSKFLELAQGQWLHQHLQLIIVGPTGSAKHFLPRSWQTLFVSRAQRALLQNRRLAVGIKTCQS
ncbi:MAG: ATP-binding protein [Leptolyngbya sp. IPPAS B-1204]